MGDCYDDEQEEDGEVNILFEQNCVARRDSILCTLSFPVYFTFMETV
jgi:hypothetical protein